MSEKFKGELDAAFTRASAQPIETTSAAFSAAGPDKLSTLRSESAPEAMVGKSLQAVKESIPGTHAGMSEYKSVVALMQKFNNGDKLLQSEQAILKQFKNSNVHVFMCSWGQPAVRTHHACTGLVTSSTGVATLGSMVGGARTIVLS